MVGADAGKLPWWKRRVVWMSAGALVVLFLGQAMGSAGSAKEIGELEDRVAALEAENAELAAQAEAAEDDLAERVEAQASLEEELDEAKAVAAQVSTLQDRVGELEDGAASLQSELDAKNARIGELESAQAAPAPAPAPEQAPAPPVQESVYYDNCDAARNAGAAPVRVGDPGYGRHLDRDGDGVACE